MVYITPGQLSSFGFFQGAIDRKGYIAVMSATLQTQEIFKQGRFKEATTSWANAEDIIRQFTFGVDFYNILKRTPYFPKNRGTQRILFTMIDYDLEEAKLARLMNGKVKAGLSLSKNIEWGGQRRETFNALTEDFLKPATDTGIVLSPLTCLLSPSLSGRDEIF